MCKSCAKDVKETKMVLNLKTLCGGFVNNGQTVTRHDVRYA
jgi:hypothetical protein